MVHTLAPLAPDRSVVRIAGLLLVLCIGGVLMPPETQGQAFGRVEETKSSVAYFYHARPGEATVQVSVWGTIPQPGIYEVPDTTDLDKLLTMAGGAPVKARQERQKAPRITVHVYRPGEGGRTEIFERRLEAMLSGDVQYPDLRDDDIVVVETVTFDRPFGWRDAISIASALGSLTLLALRIFTRV